MKTYIQLNEVAHQEYLDRLHHRRALEVLAQAKLQRRPVRFLPQNVRGIDKTLSELKAFGKIINEKQTHEK